MNFNKACYVQGILTIEKKDIAINYVKGFFFMDLLVLFPLFCELAQIKAAFKFWNLFVLFKLGNYYEIMNTVTNLLSNNRYWQNILNLLRLVLFVCFVAHVVSTLWLGMAYLQEYNDWNDRSW
jgi:hypothetical protein